jgi:preprotein translocase subunit Sec63
MELKDYYQTLGIAEVADNKAVKAGYRKLASKYHRNSEGSFSDFYRAAFAGDSNSYSTRRDRE